MAEGSSENSEIERWRGLLAEAAQKPPPVYRAITYLKKWDTASKPVLLRCSDGSEFVVKGANAGKQAVNDQIVGRLGRAMGAPVGEVALVEVPQELVAIEPEMTHVTPGLAHGSRLIGDCSERARIRHHDDPDNRGRFAALAVLYGWIHASDHQVIYENTPPHRVHSVDHGHFLPGGPKWSVESLRKGASPAPDPALVSTCGLTDPEIRAAAQGLRSVSDETICRAIAAVPRDWAITEDERLALARYLAHRRDELIRTLLAD